MAKKQKYYVVWKGRKPGVYDKWENCQQQVLGFEAAAYKSFESRLEAEKAFSEHFAKHIYKKEKTVKPTGRAAGKIIYPSIAVDGAWNTATGDTEYQGVDAESRKKIFHQGPFKDGTNNIAEFLALVHALALCQKRNSRIPIYSDSRTAISWVKNKKAKTTLVATERNKQLFEMLDRAENWLKENSWQNPILKWETESWGENPADFGRK